MKVIVADHAGYCFGVARAVKRTFEEAKNGGRIATIGELIHNPYTIGKLREAGVETAEIRCVQDAEAFPRDTKLIIRSHGIDESLKKELEAAGFELIDATCPYVEKIHRIAAEETKAGRQLILMGDREHPEIQGIASACVIPPLIFPSASALSAALENEAGSDKPVTLAAQTTFDVKDWDKSVKFVTKVYANHKICDTICNVTSERQKEAGELASRCDVMIVIGGKNSSNTAKLAALCERCGKKTVLIETACQLDLSDVPNDAVVGIVAGASTPADIIKEVVHTMTDENKILEAESAETEPMNEEISFEQALENSLVTLTTGELVKGTVVSISPTEVRVQLGVKADGFIPVSDFNLEPGQSITDVVNVGDEIEAIAARINDGEGLITLSRRRLEAQKTWDAINDAVESKAVLECRISEAVKGGLVGTINGIRIFIPASQSLSRLPETPEETEVILKTMVGTTQKIRILENNRRKRRVVGTIRSVLLDERREQREKFWETAAVGDIKEGVVKSLTNFGAFVDIGGVDGMVHVTEISWNRIRVPADALKIGEKVRVKIKTLDTEKKQIGLSIKELTTNPWDEFTSKYNVGDVITVKAMRFVPFGAFCEIIPGVDGLIHISQVSDKRIETVASELKPGQEIEVKIIAIDGENKKVSLSRRALLVPAEEAAEEASVEAAE